jgi:hypothetical protein
MLSKDQYMSYRFQYRLNALEDPVVILVTTFQLGVA